MAETKAWLLTLGNDLQAAIGHHHMAEYIAESNIKIKKVPLIFEYSPGVLVWNKQIIPLIDVALFITPKQKVAEPIKGVIVVAYQDAPGELLKNAGLLLRASPREIMVNSEMASELTAGFTSIADACFQDNDKPTPVLRLEHIFGNKLRDAFIEQIQKRQLANQQAKKKK